MAAAAGSLMATVRHPVRIARRRRQPLEPVPRTLLVTGDTALPTPPTVISSASHEKKTSPTASSPSTPMKTVSTHIYLPSIPKPYAVLRHYQKCGTSAITHSCTTRAKTLTVNMNTPPSIQNSSPPLNISRALSHVTAAENVAEQTAFMDMFAKELIVAIASVGKVIVVSSSGFVTQIIRLGTLCLLAIHR